MDAGQQPQSQQQQQQQQHAEAAHEAPAPMAVDSAAAAPEKSPDKKRRRTDPAAAAAAAAAVVPAASASDTQGIEAADAEAEQSAAPEEDKRAAKKKRREKKVFDMSNYHQRHVALRVAYLGWNYQGFAQQDSTDNTIEEALFSALAKCCLIVDRASCGYSRCGRTDKGVSAFAQVVAMRMRWRKKRSPDDADAGAEPDVDYCTTLNRALPADIRVLAWAAVPEDFDARFQCTYRLYKYFISGGALRAPSVFLAPPAGVQAPAQATANSPFTVPYVRRLDVEKIRQACTYFVGQHDYRNFCRADLVNVSNFVRTIYECNVEAEETGDLVLTVRGAGFLWHQVRCMVAILLRVGEGAEPPEVVRDMLDVERCPGKPVYSPAPERPLVLYDCGYDAARVAFRYTPRVVDAVHGELWTMWQGMCAQATMLRFMVGGLQAAAAGLAGRDGGAELAAGAAERWASWTAGGLTAEGAKSTATLDERVASLGAGRKRKLMEKRARREHHAATSGAAGARTAEGAEGGDE
eukprot:m51a1_g13196 hypothetical protein (522) ;mRNA; f:510-2458